MASLTLAATVYAATKIISAAWAWFTSRNRHPRERGVLVGCSLGSSSALFVLPLLYTGLFSDLGQRIGILCAAIDLVMSTAGSYFLFSTAGAAFPESFEHTDGGRYRGEWKGMLKDGFGVYTYPSGARYEGQWRDGVKDGRGVYHFPKGGIYEGEWRGGVMSGIGVRTFASGKVKAGVWNEGKLESSLEELQCVLAVEGANEAAAVSRNIDIGSASLTAVAKRGLAVPGLWALLIALILNGLKLPLSPSIDTITRSIAPAHGPLALISVGLLSDFSQRPKSEKDVSVMKCLCFLYVSCPMIIKSIKKATWMGDHFRWLSARLHATKQHRQSSSSHYPSSFSFLFFLLVSSSSSPFHLRRCFVLWSCSWRLCHHDCPAL